MGMEIEPKIGTEINTDIEIDVEQVNKEPLNPWFSMWTKPRETIQQIVDTNPEHSVIFLSAIAGFAQALDQASVRNLGDSLDWPMIFLFAAIVGPIFGMLGLFISGALIRWTGSWLNGKGSPQEIRAALAWSGVPIIWMLLLWLPKLPLFGQEMFTSETPIIASNPTLIFILMGFALIQLIVAIWSSIVLFKSLGQVQGFSAWKALGNSLLAGFVVIIPIFVVAFIIFSLIG